MPWEIDYCLLLFNTLSSAKVLTHNKFKIKVALNLSSYIIDWSKSKLDKEYFIEKMNYYIKLLDVFDEVDLYIYDGDENYGHLDLQKAVVHEENDYYIPMCPDQLIDKSILSLFEQSVEVIEEKYFLITPEIPKFWDTSWDIISNEYYSNMPIGPDGRSYDFLSINRYEALSVCVDKQIELIKLDDVKFAGWFDLYSKSLYEEIIPVPHNWSGYGQWDLYAMLTLKNLNNIPSVKKIPQYKLKNMITTSIEYSNWMYGENRSVYKNRLHINDVPNQREYFDTQVPLEVKKQLHIILNKGVLNHD